MGRRRMRWGRFAGIIVMTIALLVAAGFGAYAMVKDMWLPFVQEDNVAKHEEVQRKAVPISQVQVNQDLQLVNGENPLKEEQKLDVVEAFGKVPISTKDIKLNRDTLDGVKKMLDAATANGHDKFFVNSGFRTQAKQKKLYDGAKDKTFVQKPGASEHETGYAVDVAYTGLTNDAFAQSEEFKWLKKNAWQYGFILRYPKQKEYVTKISYEPWHYRYVGIPHAYYCFRNDLTLEEYLDFLLKTKECSVKIGEVTYSIYYTKPVDGKLEVPVDGEYSVSSDNRGGYIITVKGK